MSTWQPPPGSRIPGFFSPTLNGLKVLQYQLYFRFALPFIDIEAEGGVDAGSGRLVDEIRGLEGGVKLSREVGRQARIQHDESNEQAHT